MNCKNVQSGLSAYLDRELTGEEMLEIRAHLAGCTECRREEADLRSLKALLGGLRVPEPTVDFEERLTAAVFRPRAQSSRGFGTSFLVFAAVAALSMVVTLGFLSPSQRDENDANVARGEEIQAAINRDQIRMASMDPYGSGVVLAPTDSSR